MAQEHIGTGNLAECRGGVRVLMAIAKYAHMSSAPKCLDLGPSVIKGATELVYSALVVSISDPSLCRQFEKIVDVI